MLPDNKLEFGLFNNWVLYRSTNLAYGCSFTYHPLQLGWPVESGTSFACLRGRGQCPYPGIWRAPRVTGWILCPDFVLYSLWLSSGRGVFAPRPDFAYTLL